MSSKNYSTDNRKRSRRSPSPRHSKRRRPEPESPDIRNYKHEITPFLRDHLNIPDTGDFWKFYDKYQAIQSGKKHDFDRGLLLNVNFEERYSRLYEKLPVLDRSGARVNISYDSFKEWLNTIRVYQDFQQKSKFGRLKKLRTAQNELPIAAYRSKIIEALTQSRVVLIAGDTGCGKSTQVPQYILDAGSISVFYCSLKSLLMAKTQKNVCMLFGALQVKEVREESHYGQSKTSGIIFIVKCNAPDRIVDNMNGKEWLCCEFMFNPKPLWYISGTLAFSVWPRK